MTRDDTIRELLEVNRDIRRYSRVTSPDELDYVLFLQSRRALLMARLNATSTGGLIVDSDPSIN